MTGLDFWCGMACFTAPCGSPFRWMAFHVVPDIQANKPALLD